MQVKSQRIDHLGIVAGVIKELKIIELINKRIPQDQREEISAGEAVAGMIINGLGFSDRPMTLTPQFFQNKAMERLLRKDVRASHFNRYKLGRALDDCYAYGCDALFAELSFKACQLEKVDCRFNSEDTTSFSLTGEYHRDSDEHAIEIAHGYSKDHRPDLKQAVLELITTHDGNIPIVSRSWSGNASDSVIFRKRSFALVESFKNSEKPRYLIADSKLYCKETVMGPLKEIAFITRIPSTIQEEKKAIREGLAHSAESWEAIDERNRCFTLQVDHYKHAQRWIVVSSDDMKSRAKKSVEKAVKKEQDQLKKELAKIEKREFSCKKDAEQALSPIKKQAKYHTICTEEVIEKKIYESRGRPKEGAKYVLGYFIRGFTEKNKEVIKNKIERKSCYVIGTTVKAEELTNKEVILAYKGQNENVERGFRFLKDPLFFTSSLFLKKPERIEGLLMVMTLALLVYSIAQRGLRNNLKETGKMLPNQIKKEISNPTLRWVFQMMEGIEYIEIAFEETKRKTITGITELRMRILACFPPSVQKIYEVAA